MKSTSNMVNHIQHPQMHCNGKKPRGSEPTRPLGSPCPRCQGPMELIQPDLKRSDALLAVCSECPAWFLVEGHSGAVIDLDLGGWLCKTSQIPRSV